MRSYYDLVRLDTTKLLSIQEGNAAEIKQLNSFIREKRDYYSTQQLTAFRKYRNALHAEINLIDEIIDKRKPLCVRVTQ